MSQVESIDIDLRIHFKTSNYTQDEKIEIVLNDRMLTKTDLKEILEMSLEVGTQEAIETFFDENYM